VIQVDVDRLLSSMWMKKLLGRITKGCDDDDDDDTRPSYLTNFF
jgi:hypothetical protein